MQEEVNVEGMQFGKKRDEVRERAAKAVDGPRHDHVELPTGCVLA
jgi:DNA invertase Pin-like site-specific DNA recombinase